MPSVEHQVRSSAGDMLRALTKPEGGPQNVGPEMVGRQVRVLLCADALVVFDGRTEIARHERSTIRGSATLVHYLEVESPIVV